MLSKNMSTQTEGQKRVVLNFQYRKDKKTILKISEKLEEEINFTLENSNLLLTDEDTGKESKHNIDDSYNHISDSQFKQKFLSIIAGNIQDNLSNAMIEDSKLKRNKTLDKLLLKELIAMKKKRNYNKMLEFREKLPVFKMKQQILNLIDQNQVILITAETGSGKTTQIAQFILDNEISKNNGSITNIACTQPRRISAISIAERVAAERAEKIGQSIGFQIKLEKKPPRHRGNILFCTTGMILKFMQNDPALRSFSHIILDEIHERSTESDFIIALLKQIIPKRPDLKVILMSATLNSDKFSEYYNNCPSINIPGITYPVEELFLEDILEITKFRYSNTSTSRINKYEKMNAYKKLVEPYIKQLRLLNKYSEDVLQELLNEKSEIICLPLIVKLVHYISLEKGPGAILIFLPGIQPISQLYIMLKNSIQFPQNRFLIHCLHSKLDTVNQKIIFEIPPEGVRKIIIATNIAETSVTIEDVVYVIDCGIAKSRNFDINKNIETLNPGWISLANVKQRKGRAGRVQPGVCYHLFTKLRKSHLKEFPTPEILCSSLEEVILLLKILQLGKAEPFLSTIMDPPDVQMINLSIDLLKKLNALDKTERLTPLGYHLAQLPLDPRTGKMILLASLFSCIDSVFSIAASLSFKDAFIGCDDKIVTEMKRRLSLFQNSDHIAFATAVNCFEKYQWGNLKRLDEFCSDNYLSKHTLKQLINLKKQFAHYLHDMKFLQSSNVKDPASNINSKNMKLIKAIVCAGLYPNISNLMNNFKDPESYKIHSSSVNCSADLPYPYVTYFLKRSTPKNICLFDTTIVSPNALLMANLNASKYDSGKGLCKIKICNGIKIYCYRKVITIVQELQKKVNDILEFKINHPGVVNWNQAEGQILKSFIKLVSRE